MTPTAPTETDYPASPVARDRWIVARRPPRRPVSAERAHCFVEDEIDATGAVRRVATVLIVNRECPFHCVMCDLWRETLAHATPADAVVRQIEAALNALPAASVVKLYNSGSFFDPRAIPPADYAAIARRLSGFDRVIVECHPAFVDSAVARFRQRLTGDLEVAMGLETANEAVLARLNKRMTLSTFARAARRLREMDVAMRAFVLVQPPFQPPDTAVAWAVRSTAFAFDHGADAVSLIAVRSGNGALDALERSGDFVPPRLSALEDALDSALGLKLGRVFADTWDLDRIAACTSCRAARVERLRAANLAQRSLPRVTCDACGAT